MNYESHSATIPSSLDSSACPYDVEALVDLYPDDVQAVVPTKGFPKEREQFGGVLYECPSRSCSARLTAGGHGHPYFLRMWANVPPRDPLPPEILDEVLSILEPGSVDAAEDALLPHLRARYDGLYSGNASFTITEFADPPTNGPAVRTCSSCGSRLERHPVYVWPDDRAVPEWWEVALEKYAGPVLSPKGPTEKNPVVEENQNTTSTDRTQSRDADAYQTGLESY